MKEKIPAHFAGRRFYAADTWLKEHFGRKTIKLAVDGGFTCPNRDGSKGVGGCTFCSDTGSGEFASTIEEQLSLYARKWPSACYLAYLQNHTNTYAPAEVLYRKYTALLADPRIEGLVIGTRPDCLGDEILDMLAELAGDHFIWLELGLQTIHEQTSAAINRCYELSCFDRAARELSRRHLRYVTHLILGLPGESEEMMLDSVRYAASAPGLFGLKLHLLNVVRGSTLAKTHPDYTPFAALDDYVDLAVRCLEIIPPHITIHRLTGDAPRPLLINPPWSFNKRTILNRIDEQLSLRDTWQGKKSGCVDKGSL